MHSIQNTNTFDVRYFIQIITDWSFLAPVIVELLVIFIKIIVGNPDNIFERVKNQLIDAPTDFMAIILGYMGGIDILPEMNIHKHWGFTLIIVIGMMAVWFLNIINRMMLNRLTGKNKKEKIIVGFELTLFFWVMYLIPPVSLIGIIIFVIL